VRLSAGFSFGAAFVLFVRFFNCSRSPDCKYGSPDGHHHRPDWRSYLRRHSHRDEQ